MIVSLPGILMQGRKRTWKKYDILYTEVDGSPVSVIRRYDKSKMASKAYTREKKKFTLANPVSTTFENLTANDLVVDVADANSTTTSGNTLYKINSNSGREYGPIFIGDETDPYGPVRDISLSGTKFYTVDTTTVLENGKIRLSAPKEVTREGWLNRSTHTNDRISSPYRDPTKSWSSGLVVDVLHQFTHNRHQNPNDLIVDIDSFYYGLGSEVKINYTPRTVVTSRGAYIEDVEGRPGDYPDNGIQGDYWYVKFNKGSTDVDYVDYIQSDGTQYINTGYIPNKNTRVEMTFQMTNPDSTNQAIFAVAGQFSFRWYGANSCFRSNGSNNVDFAKTIDATAKHTVVKTATKTTIDDTYSVNTNAGNVSLALYLFGQNVSNAVQNRSKIKVFAFKIYDNDLLVRDYRPCINPNGVACMYDAVNDAYVYNAGSGNFIAG